MAVRQVTMRRCLVKLITGIGTNRKKIQNENAKQPAISKRNVTHDDVQYTCMKSRIRCWALADVII